MKIEVRKVNGSVRVEMTGTNAHEFQQLRVLVETLNGKPLDKENVASNIVFDLPVRIESVGFDDDGSIESIAIEGPLPP